MKMRLRQRTNTLPSIIEEELLSVTEHWYEVDMKQVGKSERPLNEVIDVEELVSVAEYEILELELESCEVVKTIEHVATKYHQHVGLETIFELGQFKSTSTHCTSSAESNSQETWLYVAESQQTNSRPSNFDVFGNSALCSVL